MEASSLPGPPGPRGRGAAGNPENRFTRLSIESEEPPPDRVETIFYTDTTRGILARNDSPDVGFSVSLNPYRGCEHGCIYCFARPTHEYLGLSAGLDFETRIFVKEDAPELLRAELGKRNYEPEVIAISGVTDPYQPVERRLEITRRCLAVLAEFRNPVAIITKNALVARDVDHLASLAEHQAALVCISITTLDPDVARVMEPRASHPRDRLAALAQLSAAGVPCAVLAAPMVPGLTDHELPAILAAAAEAGARSAHFIPIRLPGAVAGLFEQWLEEHFPDRKDKVLNRIRGMRGGRLNDPRFGSRMKGEGIFVEQMQALYQTTCRRLGLSDRNYELSTAAFSRPGPAQLDLFGG
ncbi:MAG TPA: PA0069 family radical SAM protein [Thermoanaerobaculia bacterium]|jgi:DNA repair photolyase|nr:PA0069 family radical SAM protein [Thermoanaerobaculia bacterium]